MWQRVNVITLHIANLAGAAVLSAALGWVTGARADDDVVFLQAGEMVVALWAGTAGRGQLRRGQGRLGRRHASPLRRPTGAVDALAEEARERRGATTTGRQPAQELGAASPPPSPMLTGTRGKTSDTTRTGRY